MLFEKAPDDLYKDKKFEDFDYDDSNKTFQRVKNYSFSRLI
jgi:hypothetical protein